MDDVGRDEERGTTFVGDVCDDEAIVDDDEDVGGL